LPVYWESLVEFAREAGVEEGELRRGLFEPGAELREVRRALDVLAAFVERLVRGEVDDRLRVDIGYAPPGVYVIATYLEYVEDHVGAVGVVHRIVHMKRRVGPSLCGGPGELDALISGVVESTREELDYLFRVFRLARRRPESSAS